MNAHELRVALRVHFPSPAHVVLEEVRSQTGYAARGQRERYADALVCSCWPSRGLWLAGVEIKVSRSDWQRELAAPNKSAAIQRWCEYWWIAAPAGIVLEGELPVTWGLLEYDAASRRKDKFVVRVKAPALTPEPMSIAFIASVLRSVTEHQAAAVAAGVHAAQTELSHEKFAKLQYELDSLKIEHGHCARDLEEFQKTKTELRELRLMLGMNWHDNLAEAQRAMQAAQMLERTGYRRVVEALREAANALEKITLPPDPEGG